MEQVRKIYRLPLREKRGAGDRGGGGTSAGEKRRVKDRKEIVYRWKLWNL